MATITTDTFLDGGTARTAGEAWACNGGRLTVRTDSRWHANAPASMTGSIGSVAISATLGGGYTIDGRKVRWLAYTAGSGTVPAIGTTITRGGVSGYLLGVWASITAAPTAVGATMPATGFIKFREVTNGPFAAGALTGIGATASGADVVGWIEVVHDQSAAMTVPRLGDFTVRGDWFALGTTTGVANQLVQIPTNGSSTNYVPGVWIAKTATPTTDDDWEFYPSIYAAAMIAANLGTDARSKFVCMETNGTIRIGHNGTTAIGFVPPAGRQIRIPNVIGRQCTTAARAVNVVPNAVGGTRPDFVTTNAGVIDIEYFLTDWFLSFNQPYSVKAHHVATFDYYYASEVSSSIDIYDGGNGISQTLDARSFGLTSCFNGGSVRSWNAPRHAVGTSDHAFEVLYCSGVVFDNVISGIVTYARSSGYPFSITQSRDLTFNNVKQFNGPFFFTTCFDCVVTGLDHVDRYVGGTNSTTPLYAVYVTSSCDGIVVDGVTFGLGGTISECQPYNGIFNATLSNNIKFRNVGTRSAFLSGGAAANSPAHIYVSGGNNRNVKVQRCYMAPTRTATLSSLNSDTGSVYEHVYGDFADTVTIADLNAYVKNCGGINNGTGQASVYGTHFWDVFTSDTAGRLVLQMNEPTAGTSAYVASVAGTPQFTSAGTLVLNGVGDEVQWEMDYWCLGVSAFANAAPTVSGTNVTFSSDATWGNHSLYYQIDKGVGYGGSWISFNQTNLALETGINPAIGFKIKFRAVCTTASTTNLLTYVSFNTVSTLAAQAANLYPLDTTTLTLTGLKTGSEIRIYAAGTQTEVGGLENSGTSATFKLTASSVDIVVLALQYENLRISGIPTVADATVPIQQAFDRNYANT